MKLEHVNCDLCGSDRYAERYRKPDDLLWRNQYAFPVVECLSCGLVYVNPRPPFEEMGHFYPANYHDARDTAPHIVRYARQFEYLASLQFHSLLDLGCARGDWLDFVGSMRSGIELHGVDAFSPGVKSNQIRFQKCTLTEAQLESDYFDVVTAWAVIEHVHTPMEYFRTVASKLKKGGKFVLLVTNSESLYGRRGYSEDVPRHLYHFGEKTLEHYSSVCGMKLERVDYDDELWDGRGWGTFRYGLGGLFGFSWERLHLGKLNNAAKFGMRVGSLIDSVVFATHWERQLRRSGIIVATMSK